MVAHDQVAPHGGAWIETRSLSGLLVPAVKSPLTEGRGLKPVDKQCSAVYNMSPLTEGRGLKQRRGRSRRSPRGSPLTEGRGLKLQAVEERMQREQVAPHGGAWIETCFTTLLLVEWAVSPLTEGRGLKHFESSLFAGYNSRPSRRGVD